MAARRVLLVEDEGLIRLMIAETLRDEGFDVVQAENGDEVIGLLDQVDEIRRVVYRSSNAWEARRFIECPVYTPGTGTPRCRYWSSPALTQNA